MATTGYHNHIIPVYLALATCYDLRGDIYLILWFSRVAVHDCGCVMGLAMAG